MRISSGSIGYEPNARPDAETVRRLADNAKIQGHVWAMWVPEQGIRFGDRCVLLLSKSLPQLELTPGPARVLTAGSFGSC